MNKVIANCKMLNLDDDFKRNRVFIKRHNLLTRKNVNRNGTRCIFMEDGDMLSIIPNINMTQTSIGKTQKTLLRDNLLIPFFIP